MIGDFVDCHGHGLNESGSAQDSICIHHCKVIVTLHCLTVSAR